MSRCVVDTNVPIVANGSAYPEASLPSIDCRISSIRFLQEILNTGTVLLDIDGAIQEEYRRYLSPSGQPGVGDRFYQAIINSSPDVVERVSLPRRADGEYEDMPRSLIDANFDVSDRKFVALARRESAPVYHAVDSDWIIFGKALHFEGVEIVHLCGSQVDAWFESNGRATSEPLKPIPKKPRRVGKTRRR